MCICITFCWTTQLFNTTFTGPMTFVGRQLFVFVLHSAGLDSLLTIRLLEPLAFGGRDLCVLVLHSAGPDSYLTLL